MGEGAGESHSQRALVTSKFPSCLFADDLGGLLVGAESKENRVTHLAVTRPLGEFYLSHELGNKPRGSDLGLHFLVERPLIGPQRLHRAIDRLKRRCGDVNAIA
jgi:hypothetical protein